MTYPVDAKMHQGGIMLTIDEFIIVIICATLSQQACFSFGRLEPIPGNNLAANLLLYREKHRQSFTDV